MKRKLLDITTVDAGYVLHQVNCRGAMGGGLAAQLRKKFPDCYTPYKKLCDETEPELKFTLLGQAQILLMDSGPFIVNLFGQLHTSHTQRETEYHALYMALLQFKFAIRESSVLPIYVPYGLGCGLGGGDWAIVSKIIEHVFKDVKNPVYICELPPTKPKK